ncbi:hypothetical protein QBC34DRAFT_476050 [Podospora aff. communis PSN243]|uniref:RING-type domain-containing protein n=1 Tax=Podospora aff. communis PSN243 TaxID=3040156 RepID=A0AAV9G7C2_9PEZI|nr:hypothetical protein QBC34DRAFT_476050 [Podospora aff. communis PSN243]
MSPTTGETTLWRDVKALILSNSSAPPPKIACGICNDSEIVIPGLHSEDHIHSAHFDRRAEDCIILPCGHMFGERCWKAHAAFKRELREETLTPQPLHCPSCRFELEFKPCGHKIKTYQLARALRNREWIGMSANETLKEVAQQMPLTATEFPVDSFVYRDPFASQRSRVVERALLDLLDGCPEGKDFLGRIGTYEFEALYKKLETKLRGTPWAADLDDDDLPDRNE